MKGDGMEKIRYFFILLFVFLTAANFALLQAEDTLQATDTRTPTALEILNPEYTKPPNFDDNVEITDASSAEDILKSVNFNYSLHNFDKAIELCKLALSRTSDVTLIARINFSLSLNYLEKGIEAFKVKNDYSYYKLSIEHAKKCLEVIPDNWQALVNIGTVYLNTREWDKAISYFDQALKYMDGSEPDYASIEFERNLALKMKKARQYGG